MNKRTLLFGALLCGSAAVLVTTLLGASFHENLSINAVNTSHVLTLDSYSKVSDGALTDKGNTIKFSRSGLSSSSGVGTLSNGGYIYNTTQISGIEKIDVSLSSGSVEIYYGKTSNSSWDDFVSGTSFDTSGISPNFFKVVATSDSVIDSIKVTYSCIDYQKEAEAIDYQIYVNDLPANTTLTDATKSGEGYDKQYRAILDLYPGDVISFKKGSMTIYPSASGDTNNVYKENSRGYLMVTDEAKQAHVYLKVTGNNYDVWASGKGSSWSRSALADGTILQAWNWSTSAIQNNLDAIKAAGYTAVQISPMQIRTGVSANTSWPDIWWALYQPFSFSVAGNNQSVLGTKDSLTSLCAAAKEKGIGIIMDVVINHLGGSSATSFDYAVKTYEPEIYNNNLYHTGYEFNDSQAGTIRGAMGKYPDLKTEDPRVMKRALALFNEYLDCGVSGFRIDAAKHIETPHDGEYASSFWPYVVNGSKRYAVKKGYNVPYYYGEVLGAGNNRDLHWYVPYMSVTEGSNYDNLRQGVEHPNENFSLISGDYYAGLNAGDYVLWAESHDLYQSGNTKGMIETNINKVYAIQASRAYAVPMYLARPSDDSTKMGSVGNTWWKDPAISAVNALHNRYAGQGECIHVGSSNKSFVNVRGSGEEAGALIINVGNPASSFSVYLPNMADGTYRDLITGYEYTVKNNHATVGFTDGVCVLVPAVSSTFYLVGNSIFTGSSVEWSKDSGIVLSRTSTNLAEIENKRFEAGAKVKIMRVFSDGRDDEWFDVTLGSSESYCYADSDKNLVFNVGGTYSIYLNQEKKYYVTGTPDSSESSSIPQQSSSQEATSDVTVTFVVSNANAGYGNRVYAVGDFCSWGDGISSGAIALEYQDGNWVGSMTRPQGTAITYKFVIAAYSNPTSVYSWEGGSNRSLTFTKTQTINCTWQ